MSTEHITLLNAALDQIERVAAIETDGEPVKTAFIYSGGSAPEHTEHIPALCTEADKAVDMWRRALTEFMEAQPNPRAFRFLEPPKVTKFVMTSDEGGGQRLAGVRYGVSSRIGVISVSKPKAVKAKKPTSKAGKRPTKAKRKKG